LQKDFVAIIPVIVIGRGWRVRVAVWYVVIVIVIVMMCAAHFVSPAIASIQCS
jgi:hypothetical protein